MWEFIFNFICGMCAGSILVSIIHLIQAKRMLKKISNAIDEREIEETIKEVRTHNTKTKNPPSPIMYELSDNDFDMHIPKL